MSCVLSNSHLSLGDFDLSLLPFDDASRIISVSHEGYDELFIELASFTGKLRVSKKSATKRTPESNVSHQQETKAQPQSVYEESRQPPPSSSHDNLENLLGSAPATLLAPTSPDSDNDRGFSSDSTDLGSGRLRIDTGHHSLGMPASHGLAPGDNNDEEYLVDTSLSKVPFDEASPASGSSSVDEETPQNRRTSRAPFSFGLISVGSGSTLHDACAQRSISFQELRDVLMSDTSAASKPDLLGQLPLHILSENEALLEHRKGRQTAHDFALLLIDINPGGILAKDKEGRMPFTLLILYWVDRVRQAQTQPLHNSGSAGNTFLGDFDFTNLARSKGNPNGSPRRSNNENESMDGDFQKNASLDASLRKYYPDVDITPVVEWCFVMLTFCLDYISGKQSRAKKRSRKWQRAARAALADNVASIPLLLQTIFLIEDDEVRTRMLELSIVRRVLLCPTSAGPWIESMLQQCGIVSHRAVDYFVELSAVNVKDFIGHFRAPQAEDVSAFQETRCKVIQKIRSMQDILPSLLVLSNKEMERAATTDVVWTVLNSGVSRPFVVATVIIDFVLHIAIIAAFREYSLMADPLRTTELPVGRLGESDLFIILTMTICVHFMIRKIGEGISLAIASKEVFRSFFLNFWNLLDVVSIVLAMIAGIFINRGNNYPELNAVVVGLLWLKLIGFLKAMNLQLATFILAVVEIIKDVRWFMLIVMLAILMFGDMMHILSTQTNGGAICEGEPDLATGDFCTDRFLDSYLRMYTVLLGDFNLHTYRDLSAITALFVMFTLLGFIVLLNVLIAVVSDSYERSRLSSKHLFGRARVGFLAEHVSLERFLHSSYRPFNGLPSRSCPDVVLKNLCCLGRWTVILSLIGTSLLSEVSIISALIRTIRDGNISGAILSGILCVLLTIAFVAVITVLFNDCIGRRTNFLASWTDRGLRFLSTRLLNASSPETNTEEESEDEWYGRLEYLNRTVEKLVSGAERTVCLAVRSSETRIMDHETSLASDLKSEINKNEQFSYT